MNEKRKSILMWSYTSVKPTKQALNFLLERYAIFLELFDGIYIYIPSLCQKESQIVPWGVYFHKNESLIKTIHVCIFATVDQIEIPRYVRESPETPF